MSTVDRWFKPVLGCPCWGVRRGYGSFLTLEFKKPRLIIREPIAATGGSRRVRRRLARRSAFVVGEWRLWVYCCNWAVHHEGRLIGDSSSARGMGRAARLLDGQKLVGVELARRGARTRFAFDLGAVLTTTAYDRSSEQWVLSGPGVSITFRADRHYRRRPVGSTREKWLPL